MKKKKKNSAVVNATRKIRFFGVIYRVGDKKRIKDDAKKRERKLIRRAFLLPRLSPTFLPISFAPEYVSCNNFATAGNDRAFRPLNMQWKLLLRDQRGKSFAREEN